MVKTGLYGWHRKGDRSEEHTTEIETELSDGPDVRSMKSTAMIVSQAQGRRGADLVMSPRATGQPGAGNIAPALCPASVPTF